MAIVARSGHGDMESDFDLDTASQGGTLGRGTLDRDWDDKFSGMHSTYIQPTPNGTLERPRNRVYQPGEEELPFPNESQGVQPQEGRYFSEEEVRFCVIFVYFSGCFAYTRVHQHTDPEPIPAEQRPSIFHARIERRRRR